MSPKEHKWVARCSNQELLEEFQNRTKRLMSHRLRGWNMPYSTATLRAVHAEILRRGLEVPES